MMYNSIVEECFFNPKHVGIIDLNQPYACSFSVGKPGQGVVIALYLQCSKIGLVERACFKAIGNPYTIAALEWLCRQTEGLMLADLPQVSYQQLIEVLQIPRLHYPVAVQVEDVYKEVIRLMRNTL